MLIPFFIIQSVLLVGKNIACSPFDPLLEYFLSHVAVAFDADAALKVEAAIIVNKKFHGLTKFLPDQADQFFDLQMCFMNIEVPGNCKMTIYVQFASVFDYPQVV